MRGHDLRMLRSSRPLTASTSIRLKMGDLPPPHAIPRKPIIATPSIASAMGGPPSRVIIPRRGFQLRKEAVIMAPG